jgi:hypothetical protein
MANRIKQAFWVFLEKLLLAFITALSVVGGIILAFAIILVAIDPVASYQAVNEFIVSGYTK